LKNSTNFVSSPFDVSLALPSALGDIFHSLGYADEPRTSRVGFKAHAGGLLLPIADKGLGIANGVPGCITRSE